MNDLPFGLSLAAVEKIRAVFAIHPEVQKAVLYGSRARGNCKIGSDIDLTMYGDHLNHHILLKIINELDDLLLPWMIDLSIFRQIDNLIYNNMTRNAKVCGRFPVIPSLGELHGFR